MKKILSFIIVMVMLVSSIGVSAQTDFLNEIYTNYTSDYNVKISFESTDEIVALVNELDFLDEIETFVNLKSLLNTILSLNTKMNVQLETSDDFKIMKASLTADTKQLIDVNKNLSADINSHTGMWINMDISDTKNPVMQVVYSYPFLNKYLVIDAFEMLNEEEKLQLASMLGFVMNREYMVAVNAYSAQLLKKYADIKISLGKYIISLDNEGLTKMLDEAMPYIMRQSANLMMDTTLSGDAAEEMMAMFDGISFEGIKLLGDKGISCTYTLKSGKISKAELKTDISVDISKIYTSLTGMEWEFVSNGNIDFDVQIDATMSKIGTTKVNMPYLTEENSFSMMDMMPEYEMIEEEPYEEELPYWYVGDWIDYLPVIEGEVFVPLRSVLEGGYSDKVNISFENGVITAVCDYFPGFKKMTLAAGSSKVYTDNGEYTTKNVIIENGTTYVSSKLFTELFKWQLAEAQHSYVTGVNYYEFYTRE